MTTTDQKTGVRAPDADASWLGHLRATLALGVPLIVALLGHMAIQVTDTIMIGWIGAEALAASVLGGQLYFLAFMLGNGFAHAVMPLAANAEGAGDIRGVRRSVRMGLWVVIGIAVLVMPLMWNGERLFLALGQEPGVSALAGSYLRAMQWGLFAVLVMMVLRSYLAAVQRAAIVVWATALAFPINALLNYMLIFGNLGAPELGIVGAGIASVVTVSVISGSLLAYVLWHQALKKYQLFIRIWRPDWVALAEVFRLGWPISATFIAEMGLFAATAIMMGWIGTIELAAHGIAVQVISIIFMVPLGLASAGTVRVGLAYGRGDLLALDKAARVVLGVTMVLGLLAATLFWIIPTMLISVFLDSANPDAAQIIAYGVPLLAVAAVFQVGDMLQVAASSLLRGLKDARVPMIMAIGSYWGVGISAAYLFGFPLGWGGQGIWAGLALGLIVAAVLLTARLFLRIRAELAAQ